MFEFVFETLYAFFKYKYLKFLSIVSIFPKIYSVIYEIKIVIVVAALLLTATDFFKDQVNLAKKVGHHSEIKSERPREKEYKKNCLNGGECCFPFDEDIVARNSTWLCGGKRCEKYML